jgi:hypothetical protein
LEPKSKWSTSDKATIRRLDRRGMRCAGRHHCGGGPCFLDQRYIAPSHPSSIAATPTIGQTWTETTFSQSKTFADYANADTRLVHR